MEMLKTFKRLNIPGPPPSLLWGNMYEIYKNGHLVMQRRWHEEYGPVFGYFFGLFPVILVADIELLKHILFKDFHNFVDRSVGRSDVAWLELDSSTEFAQPLCMTFTKLSKSETNKKLHCLNRCLNR